MYKNQFSSYVKIGFQAAFIITIVANITFVLSGFIFRHEINFIGQDRDTLYIVFITFATVMAVFIGTIIFYFLQKYTNKPVPLLVAIVLLGFLFNTYTAEVDLAEHYKLTAHIVHIVVSILAIYLIPKLANSSRAYG